MIANSLAGVASILGETVTLQAVDRESYNTTTRTVTKSTTSHTVERVTIRGINAADRRKLGAQLVKETTQIASIIASSLPAGVTPGSRDKIVDASDKTWEILRVTITRAGGVPVGYVCQLAGR